MAEAQPRFASDRLFGVLRHYLFFNCPWIPLVASSLRRTLGEPRVCIFGGMLRDLVLHGERARPRDVDLVVDGVTSDEMFESLRPYIVRTTRFGGLQLRVAETEIDIWPLSATWAFQKAGWIHPSLKDLPKTTFLNIEAIVAEVDLVDSVPGRIFSHGFFEAIETRTLELNFCDNPFPLLCVARSLDLASRIGYAIGPELSRYVSEILAKASIDDLVAAHSRVHGTAPCPNCLFSGWRKAITQSGAAAKVLPPQIADNETPQSDLAGVSQD